MQTRSQTKQKDEQNKPAAKAVPLSFDHLKNETIPNAISSKDEAKQEDALLLVDTKANIEQVAAKASVNHSSNMCDTNAAVVVKTEPRDDHFKQHIERKHDPDLHDGAYYYNCRSCNQTRTNLKSLLEHRKEAHLKSQRKNCPIKHVMLEPDIDDSNHYCRTCEKRFFTRQHYKQHLNLTHHMVIIKSTRLPSRQHDYDELKKDAHLSINKFNHYCKPCQRFYCSRSSYDTHVYVAHNTASSSSLQNNTTTTTNNNTTQRDADTNQHDAAENRYCSLCNKTISKDYFKLHMTLRHSTQDEPVAKKKSYVVLKPKVNDPNHYCSVCQHKFDSKTLYHDHLQNMHNMALQFLIPKDPTILPNPHNQRNYCRVCKRTMTSRALYRLHCKYSHFMKLEPLVVKSRVKSRFA